MIMIAVTSVFVEDQDAALAFYADVLGFEQRNDIALGGDDRWLTVASPAGPEGVELLLEPNGNPIAKAYQQGTFEAGIPATTFAVDDLHAELQTILMRRCYGAAIADVWDACSDPERLGRFFMTPTRRPPGGRDVRLLRATPAVRSCAANRPAC